MKTYRVYFDYEQEDAVEVTAPGPVSAKILVLDRLVLEHGWEDEDRDGLYDALNAVLA